MPHHLCPDKVPAVRMGTIDAAGQLDVPFTTGILVGIGETTAEIVDSLLALRAANDRGGHIQEYIIQNFRAKANTRMRFSPEPEIPFFVKVVAVSRWILGPTANIQVPPNLTEDFSVYLDAGINDWGGVSPVTIDWVNPEAPWPHLDTLATITENAGYSLVPRLPVYPEYVSDTWIDKGLIEDVLARTDDDGYAVLSRARALP
jgi:FO synthase